VSDSNTLRKLDLHVHTPVSTCYGDKSATPEEIVDAAISNGLDVIAVTDHNACEGIEDISRAGVGKGLFVFPGVEISTKEGHFIALFSIGTSTAIIRTLLDKVGISKDIAGDGHAVAQADINTVLRVVHEANGIVIAAHIDRWPSGFIESQQSRTIKEAIHASNYIDALEITIPQNKPLWNDGLVRGYPKKYACLQSSDAHKLIEIGRRPVYIEMEEIVISELRSAIIDFRNKIVFPDELNKG